MKIKKIKSPIRRYTINNLFKEGSFLINVFFSKRNFDCFFNIRNLLVEIRKKCVYGLREMKNQKDVMQ